MCIVTVNAWFVVRCSLCSRVFGPSGRRWPPAGAAARAADPTATPAAVDTEAPQARPHNGGTIAGTVTAVDYQRAVITLQPVVAPSTTPRPKVDVIVLPSTAIEGHDSAYYSLADIVRGTKLVIWTSLIGTQYNAQLIRIR